MKEDLKILENIITLEQTIKECINKKEPLPKHILAILDEAKYSLNILSDIVKSYKV